MKHLLWLAPLLLLAGCGGDSKPLALQPVQHQAAETKLFKSNFLAPIPGPVTLTLTVARFVGLPGADTVFTYPNFPTEVPNGTISAGVWEQDGLTYVNANVATWDKTYFAGTPYELSYAGSAGSVVFGSPLEFNSAGIVFAGQPVFVGFSPSGGFNTNVKVSGPNGAQLTVNEVEANANGVLSTGLHLVVPGVGEAWFNSVQLSF